jgi:hypothetical protein
MHKDDLLLRELATGPLGPLLRACAILAVVAASHCAHDRPARLTTEIDSALHTVKIGEARTAQAGEVVVQRTEDASIGVWRGERGAARATRKDVPDPAIAEQVKQKVAASAKADARDIEVHVHEGVVTLSGNVGSVRVAGAAVRDALDTEGVAEVRTHLDYPPPAEKKPD